MATWGGNKELWLNVYEWFWAIAEYHESPASMTPEELAVMVGCTVAEAETALLKAERVYRSNVRANQRAGARQSYHRCVKSYLVAHAKKLGIQHVDGWWTKSELVDAIVNLEHPDSADCACCRDSRRETT